MMFTINSYFIFKKHEWIGLGNGDAGFSMRWEPNFLCNLNDIPPSPYGSTALYGPGPPRFFEASRSHTLDTPQSVRLLWTSDQPDADTST